MAEILEQRSMACPNCKDATALFQKNVSKVFLE